MKTRIAALAVFLTVPLFAQYGPEPGVYVLTSSRIFSGGEGVPFARAISPITKTNWEGTGVQPDVAMPAPQALDAAYVMALEKVVAETSDPQRKAGLQRLLEEKKKAR